MTFTITLLDKFTSKETEKTYIQNIFDPVTNHTMVTITDGSAQGNTGMHVLDQ